MNKQRKVLLFSLCGILLLFSCGVSSAETDTVDSNANIELLLQQLGQPEFLQGEFTQTRTLGADMPPLLSRGHFVYWKSQGLYWAVNEPFFQATTFMEEQWINWSAPGEVLKVSKNLGRQRKYASQFMLSIFKGDWQTLSKLFEVRVSGQKTDWHVSMKPRNEAVGKLLAEIQIQGSTQVRKLSVQTTDGEKLAMDFGDVLAAPAPEQCSYFLNCSQ